MSVFAKAELLVNKAVNKSLTNVTAIYGTTQFLGMFDEKPDDGLGIQVIKLRLRYLASQLDPQPSEGDTIVIRGENYIVARPLEYDNEFIVMSLFK